MKKEIIEIEVKGTGKGIKQVDKLTDAIENTGDASEKTSKQVESVGKSGEKSKKGLKSVSIGLKGIGLALKAAGIGIIVGLFASLASIMSENQKVMDVINTVTTTLSLTFNAITSAISNAWNAVKDATDGFDAMKKVIGGLLKLAITPLKLAFFSIKAAIIAAQLGWEQSFLGKGRPEKIKELSEALLETKDDIKRIGEEAIQAGKDIAVNFVEAINEVGALAKATVSEVSNISLKSIVAQAKAQVALKNTAQLAVAQQALLIEKYDIQAEKLRQIRDEERNSIDERIKANDELKAVLDSQEKSMISLANLQIKAAQAELSRNNTIENQVALTDALANRQGVLAQIEGFRSEQLINDLGLDKEKIELTNSLSESEAKLFIERKRFNAEQIEDERQKLLALQEIDAIEQEMETVRLQSIINSANAGTQAKIDAQIVLDEFLEQSRQTNILREKALNKEKIKDEIILQNQKLRIVNQTFGKLVGILGKNSAAGKAAAIAQATINTYQGITEVWSTKSTLPEPFATISRIASTATVLASGLSAVRQIKSQQLPQGAGGVSVSSASAQSISPIAQTPNFNPINDSLALAIGGQSQQPVQAFVVSNDVTTSQSLERNIITSASLG